MIFFEDWTLQVKGQVIAQQFDHLTRTLVVKGDLPEGWEWVMLVRKGEHLDILALETMEEGVGLTLTAQQLALAGYYTLQLRGTKEERVRHTNVIVVYIAPSLSGDVQWPELPDEFTQLEHRVNQAAVRAEQAAATYPIIGENKNWWLWDGEQYADTGVSAIGPEGAVGPAYELTHDDKQNLIETVLNALPAAEGKVY